jgi:hypothetical protein
MTIIKSQTGLTVCNGTGKPVKPKIYSTFNDTFDSNYELDAVDKATVFITMFVLVAGIVYATFGG